MNSETDGAKAAELKVTIMHGSDDVPLCDVHARLDKEGALVLAVTNNCVACALNERAELIDVLATVGDPKLDSVSTLREVITRAASQPDAQLREALSAVVETLNVCRQEWDGAGNGKCNVCEVGYRYFDQHGDLGQCDYAECLSHHIRESLQRGKAALASTPERSSGEIDDWNAETAAQVLEEAERENRRLQNRLERLEKVDAIAGQIYAKREFVFDASDPGDQCSELFRLIKRLSFVLDDATYEELAFKQTTNDPATAADQTVRECTDCHETHAGKCKQMGGN